MSDETGVATTKRAFQFRLRDLFIATTCVAAVASLAHYRGAGTLMLSCGALIVLANCGGWFTRLQYGRPQHAMGLLATGLFAESLFFPMRLGGIFPDPLPGWQCLLYVLAMEADLVLRMMFDSSWSQHAIQNALSTSWVLAILAAFNFCILIMATTVFAPWRWSRLSALVYPVLAILVATFCWLVTWRAEPSSILIGWWFLLASSYVLAAIARPPWFALTPVAVLWLFMWYK